MAEATGPLSLAEAAACFRRVVAPGAAGLVLAVSGGPDSMALLHLAAGLHARSLLPELTVATVDHGLRPDSGEDAAFVETASTALGLPCRRLPWLGPKPTSAVQDRAREARYRLLTGLCAELGADHLITAHTRDDQAETVLFRVLRGSGIAGLAAMSIVSHRDGLRLCRPFLDVAKARLVATCRAHDCAVHEDPANADPRFARARLRRILPLLATEGFGPTRLARLAERTRRADIALCAAADEAHRACSLPSSAGSHALVAARLVAFPLEITIRVVAKAIAKAGGRTERFDRLERLTDRIVAAVANGSPLLATLGGVLVRLSHHGVLTMTLEATRRRGLQKGALAEAGGDGRDGDARASFPWQA